MTLNELLYADRDEFETRRAIEQSAFDEDGEFVVYLDVFKRLYEMVIKQAIADLCSREKSHEAELARQDARIYLTDRQTQPLLELTGLKSKVERKLKSPVKPKALRCATRHGCQAVVW